MTFTARWTAAVAAGADRPFLIWEGPDGGVTEWTYGEFDALVDRVAGGLAARGVTPGARVGLALRNSPAFVAIWLACAKLGAAMVACDPSAPPAELAGLLRRTSAVLAVRAEGFDAGVPVLEVSESDVTLDSLAGPAVAYGRPGPLDPLGLMFTSGTTSAPKCVVVTQANYAFAGDVMAAAAALRADDCQLVVLPLFHANAQYYSFAAAISAGASVALMHAFSATRFLTQAARHEATHASLFAAPMRMILARGNTPVPGLRLVHCWYAQNLTDEQYAEMAALLGCAPRQLYGMTETIPAVLTNPAVGPLPRSMGRTTLGCEVLVATPGTCEPAPPGTEGEILVGGDPGTTLFAGYLDDPETTRASFRGDWFVTGDRGTVDDDGNVFFAGRGGDVLKVAGENVSVVEIESVIAGHPGVFEVAVVGEPDPVRDEVPVAYVVPRDGADVRDLGDWCAERLAKAKRPARFEVVEALPRTSVGKIRKFLLTRH
ncbi:crotonobetaine/carnitine-CoA ligase [Thermocatellispora tengchongensis]|uniref:Crotonobetaine/carnitine-CoA ligase n=1 Tax=Thermocatellispora tengchongensis TaxID=1073253 RepID=A0A840NUN7_9ACTN|nr:AMP-binding protein [Thermocatellispora tengchongensis]MBB5130962.1 crotonobetaine/carnitine-CoA ligase [Thermocatellispora tengchongensis]